MLTASDRDGGERAPTPRRSHATRPRLERFGVLQGEAVFGTNRAAVATLASGEAPKGPQKHGFGSIG
jgi:hypothetical protein